MPAPVRYRNRWNRNEADTLECWLLFFLFGGFVIVIRNRFEVIGRSLEETRKLREANHYIRILESGYE